MVIFLDIHADGKGTLYKGMVNCFVKIFKSEGLLGLYKGVGINYMRIARHTSFCLVFWELLKDVQDAHFGKTDKRYTSDAIIKS